jgi:NAD(P)-dependent dehydrogenase (short-subunit alcohol dehydrogenase family)
MDNHVALVTGASSGIGEATARALLRRGFTVYGAARRVGRMTALAEAGVHVLAMDVTDDASMVAGMKQIIEERGRLDVLVNNAGYGSYGALEDVGIDEARYQIEVNLLGMARLTQLALPHLRRQGAGRIINVSSVFGRIGGPLGAWYHATKYAVEGLSTALRLELKPFGVDVVLIEPGSIRTEWGQIAIDKLLAVSGDTAYGPQAEAVAGLLGGRLRRMAADPQVIADAIGRAATARRPAIRYVAPAAMKVPLLLTRVLSDRMIDAAMLRFFGTTKRH